MADYTPDIQQPEAGPDTFTLGLAARVAVRERARGVTTPTLCRRLGLDWSEAQDVADLLESAGIVGPFDGVKPRPVFVDDEEMAVEMITNKMKEPEKS